MSDRLQELLALYQSGRLSEKERTELMGLWLEPSLEPAMREWLSGIAAAADDKESMTAVEIQTLLSKIIFSKEDKAATPVIGIQDVNQKKIRKRWMVAASIVVLLGLGTYFLNFNNSGAKPGSSVVVANDIVPPQSSKASILLADGKRVNIDSLTTMNDGSIQLAKNENGEITYKGTDQATKFNTLDNPRGSPVATITLIDGTKVWLNAGSSIKYFASNAGAERKVEINGEAYFEVTKDPARPFIVSKNETAITVLGTHFNVNAYDDEENLTVTLLEGSVEVKNKSSKEKIRPGQQVTVDRNLVLTLHHSADLREIMSWKEGMLHFENASMETILREVARWYDVDVVYVGKPSAELYFVLMKRTSNLSAVLKAFETGNVKFSITGKTLTVKK
jgi:transmembrane sensor